MSEFYYHTYNSFINTGCQFTATWYGVIDPPKTTGSMGVHIDYDMLGMAESVQAERDFKQILQGDQTRGRTEYRPYVSDEGETDSSSGDSDGEENHEIEGSVAEGDIGFVGTPSILNESGVPDTSMVFDYSVFEGGLNKECESGSISNGLGSSAAATDSFFRAVETAIQGLEVDEPQDDYADIELAISNMPGNITIDPAEDGGELRAKRKMDDSGERSDSKRTKVSEETLYCFRQYGPDSTFEVHGRRFKRGGGAVTAVAAAWRVYRDLVVDMLSDGFNDQELYNSMKRMPNDFDLIMY